MIFCEKRDFENAIFGQNGFSKCDLNEKKNVIVKIEILVKKCNLNLGIS